LEYTVYNYLLISCTVITRIYKLLSPSYILEDGQEGRR